MDLALAKLAMDSQATGEQSGNVGAAEGLRGLASQGKVGEKVAGARRGLDAATALADTPDEGGPIAIGADHE